MHVNHARGERPRYFVPFIGKNHSPNSHQCSGPPGPCVACRKAEHGCYFSHKNESGIKTHSSSATHGGEVSVLIGVLQALKYGSDAPLMHLIRTMRQSRPCPEIVNSLRFNLELLQDRGIVSKAKIEDADLLSLAEKSNSNRLAWGEQSSQQMFDTIQEVPKESSQDQSSASSSDLIPRLPSHNDSTTTTSFKFPRDCSTTTYSPDGKSPASSASLSTQSIDINHTANFQNIEFVQHTGGSNSSAILPGTFHYAIQSPTQLPPNSIHEYDQSLAAFYTYGQYSEQQSSYPSAYPVGQSVNLNITTLSAHPPPTASAMYFDFAQQPHNYSTQPLNLPPREGIIYTNQRAY